MTEVAVVGAGLMGHALALVYALGGHAVRLTDSKPETLARAPGLMATALATLREGGEVDASWTSERLARAVQPCATLAEAVKGAALVVEAIVEETAAKRTLYAALAGLMDATAVLASNTSHLDIFPLVPDALQSRTLIAHWYTPPYLVDLVDVVGSPRTDPAAIEFVRATVAAMGKAPVVFQKFVPGYVANRIQAAISQEVYRMIDEGLVTPREVDLSVIHGLALRIPVLGHLAKADFTGLPLVQRSMANKKDAPPPPPPRGNSPTLDKLLAAGHTGVMSGRGFFDWGGRTPEELFRDRDRRLITLKQAMRKMGGPLEGK
ncbi:MAG: 3-hydroxyacyl-CoA dehydrogenase family protein [Proteobacteria bacterium]|nr:3-hydroxyacyl-CoA dehydrogenase family protein [Pseudomonadota bacterium]